MEELDMNANICESKTLNANTFSDSFQADSHTKRNMRASEERGGGREWRVKGREVEVEKWRGLGQSESEQVP